MFRTKTIGVAILGLWYSIVIGISKKYRTNNNYRTSIFRLSKLWTYISTVCSRKWQRFYFLTKIIFYVQKINSADTWLFFYCVCGTLNWHLKYFWSNYRKIWLWINQTTCFQEYWLLGRWVSKTIGLTDIGFKTQTIELSNIWYIKNYRLPAQLWYWSKVIS
jgi:hypothetical protein